MPTLAPPDAAAAAAEQPAPFDEQLAYLRRKLNVPTERWDDIWQSAHDRAFVVAGALKADLLQDLHLAVERAAAGSGLAAFRREFEAITMRRGWSGWTGSSTAAGRAWRTAVIYDTNLAASHAAGRWRQLQALKTSLPWWRYRHADGVIHPRPQHQAWNGLTLPADHPFWRTHFPPNGWGCHCKVFAQAAPEPGAPTAPPAGWEQGAGADEGWGYAPGAQVGVPLREMVEAKLITYPPAIRAVFKTELGRYIDTETHPVAYAEQALADRRTKLPALWLGFVERPQRLAAAAGGRDLANHVLVLSSDAVLHAVNRHADDADGQRPVVAADFAQVAALVNAADTTAAPARSGTRLVLTRQVGAEQFEGVFEVSSGPKSRTLSLVTLYVRTGKRWRVAKDGGGAGGP
ncbi:MAG: phage head morphogenesis protein [Proteobacteria bacterium]|nr:phage head morphogenesis protein [Pseudomonadota bacterium]